LLVGAQNKLLLLLLLVGGAQNIIFPREQQSYLSYATDRWGLRFPPNPHWPPEGAARPPPTSNGEMLATRLIEVLLHIIVYCFAPFFSVLFSFLHKH